MEYNSLMNSIGPTAKINPARKKRSGCLVVLLFLLLIIIASPLILRGLGGLLIYADPLENADAAVALSGDTGDRVSTAAWLYDEHYVDALYITYTEDAARDALILAANQGGIDLNKIHVTEATVSNTVEEARAIRTLATNKGADSLIIITDPFHTLRTRVIFKHELRDRAIDIQVRPVGGHWYRSNTWYKTPEGIRLTIEEYLKIILYYFGKY